MVPIAKQERVAEGQLLRLDRNARKLVILTATGSQLQCTYTVDTRVVGAWEHVADVPAMARVKVHYAKDKVEYVATEIRVSD